jgi:predicted nucleic acid-binding protein
LITADTNIFVYAFDGSNPGKQTIAAQVTAALRRLRAPVALQVIGEFQNVLRRKLKASPRDAAEHAEDILGAYDIFLPSKTAAASALEQMALGRLSYWDALMLASAREAGCTTFISEDLQHGARPLGLEIVNPFGAAGPSARLRQLLGL